MIPVIDLFAGPGGLGEGFSSMKINNQKKFHIVLSVEKDKFAAKTLLTRKLFRSFEGNPPASFYRYLNNEISFEELIKDYPKEYEKTKSEILEIEISKKNREELNSRISEKLKGASNWILIGGPPCQAYSLAGRSRILGKQPNADDEKYKKNPDKFTEDFKNYQKKFKDYVKDERHELYREYLSVISDHKPPVFVMENVQGILSSKAKSGKQNTIINKILKDLEKPNDDLNYDLFPLVQNEQGNFFHHEPKSFLIHSDRFGIPQTRNRVIIVGHRKDLTKKSSYNFLSKSDAPNVKEIISDLPKIRGEISRREKIEDNFNNWKKILNDSLIEFKGIKEVSDEFKKTIEIIKKTIEKINKRSNDFNSNKSNSNPKVYESWFKDKSLKHPLNHESRSHIIEDIKRYLYASSFALANEISPKLENFPDNLLPKHKNINRNDKSSTIFKDRFRVQLSSKPATTITSHISKDGHYFIHYDPVQARTLTVREAARIQTFPDNYYFEGPRTEQYKQVGNAVPPLLACRISKVIYDNFFNNESK
tara:strand:+ start:375 stop:1982 length:1608 start_codon:yes stop_codon:yes gene_type:complete